MDILNIIDWLALFQITGIMALAILSYRMAKRLEAFDREGPEFHRTAALPAVFSLALVGLGTYAILAARLPLPGGNLLTGIAAMLGGGLLIMTGFSLEATIIRQVRRVQGRDLGALRPSL